MSRRSIQLPNSSMRRQPVGAELLHKQQFGFRVWAPKRRRCELLLVGGQNVDDEITFELDSEPGGYFSCVAPEAKPGMRYGFRLDGEDRVFPDPASRFQPDGPAKLSQIVDPDAFRWTDESWP